MMLIRWNWLMPKIKEKQTPGANVFTVMGKKSKRKITLDISVSICIWLFGGFTWLHSCLSLK